ncbi:hypothetical protein Aduo_005320 [Ancylostoma duodenale]
MYICMLLQDEDQTKFGFLEDQQRIHRGVFSLDQEKSIIYQVLGDIAKHVLDIVSRTYSTIHYIDGETPYLLFNNQLRIHPSAVSQLIQSSSRRTTNTETKNESTEVANNDLEEVLRITQFYDTNQMPEKKYYPSISGVLQKHRMITEAEISKVQNNVKQQINLSDERKKMFENMRPTVAFRFRTVLMGACPGDMAAAMKIAECVGGEDVAYNPAEIANCVEIEKLHFLHEMKEFELAKTSEIGDMDIAQKQQTISYLYRRHFDLSDEEVATMNSGQVSKKNKKKHLAKRYADNVVNNEQRRAEVVQHINEGIILAGQYETGLLSFSSRLSGYYHVEKHGRQAVLAFHLEKRISVPQNCLSAENISMIYFKMMPEYLFTKENLQSTIVSQDGKTLTRTWATKRGYVGYTQAPYIPVPDMDLNSDPPLYLPGETVASHYQKNKLDFLDGLLFCFLLVGLSGIVVFLLLVLVTCIALWRVMIEHLSLSCKNALDPIEKVFYQA